MGAERNPFKKAILAKARELGFELAGVAPAGRIPSYGRYREWLAAGHAGEMAWMARNPEKREDPANVLPDVQSILVVGMNYFTVPAHAAHPPSRHRGVLSRYGWGYDYHDLMGQRLSALLDFIRSEGPEGADGRWYVDTGPLLERDIASRSGIGWVGKHTNLINKGMGTWFFLGEILLNLPLTPDEPASAHCGKCTRCLDVCPTQAITAPYVVDSRRCISYLTIELKGPIPRDLRPLVGNRIYGCDDCVDVCPWNRFARASREAAFQPRMDPPAPLLRDLLAMDEKAFRETFRGGPIRRIKRHGFLRNVAVAVGNSGDRHALPALRNLLGDPHPLIRGHVAWAIGRLGGSESVPRLEEAMAAETEAWGREEIQAAMGRLSGSPGLSGGGSAAGLDSENA